MGGWFPSGYLMAEFTAWLVGGIALSVAAGTAAGILGRTRRKGTWAGLVVGAVGVYILLALTIPHAGGVWEMWIPIGTLIGAGAAWITALLAFSMKRIIASIRGRHGRGPSDRSIP